MAESRHGCTPAQQSMCSSNPLAFTSRFSAVAAELLISRHVPCHKHLFCVQKFPFLTDFQGLPRKSSKFLPKGWDSRKFFRKREGFSAVSLFTNVLHVCLCLCLCLCPWLCLCHGLCLCLWLYVCSYDANIPSGKESKILFSLIKANKINMCLCLRRAYKKKRFVLKCDTKEKEETNVLMQLSLQKGDGSEKGSRMQARTNSMK